MGINVQQLMAQDPETLQRQAYMREMQQLNPSGSAAGALGAVLGRGIGNVTQGRGFFQTNDAGLQRVAQAQSIYNEVMRDFDPENPASSLTMLSKRLADAGLAEPAMLAAQEAAKYSAQRRAEKRAEYRDDPYAMIEDAMALPEDDPKRTSMLSRASRALSKENYDIAIREANLKRAQERDDKGKILTGRDAMGNTIFYKEEGGKIKVVTPEGGTAAATSTGDANSLQAQAQAAYKKRIEQDSKRNRAAATGTAEAEINPYTGQVEYRNVAPVKLSPAEKEKLSRSELQEYNRTGKIPANFFER